jgi:hypothetical protein
LKLFSRLEQYGRRPGTPFEHWVMRLVDQVDNELTPEQQAAFARMKPKPSDLVSLTAGCASLSLFSSNHYHGTPEIENRLDCLERRVGNLEATNGGCANPAATPRGPGGQFYQAPAQPLQAPGGAP